MILILSITTMKILKSIHNYGLDIISIEMLCEQKFITTTNNYNEFFKKIINSCAFTIWNLVIMTTIWLISDDKL